MTTPPLKRLRIGLTILGIIFVVAVLGYWVAGWNLIDSLYMVAMILSTVGLGEVHQLNPALKVFTTLLIVVGVSAVFYIVGGMIQMMAEGEIDRALGMRRVSREIERLSGHIVICGFGRMGEILARELRRLNVPLVILENDPERIAAAGSLNYPALNDDATEEEALRHAGVGRAKTLVTTLPRDADNVFITLTARNLNPDLMIIARGEFPTTEKKLIQAGADRVVLPAATGALRMAAMITRPSAVMELIEVVAGRQVGGVEVDEIIIPDGNPLVGVSVRNSQTRSRHGLLIVAVRQPDGKLIFNPDPDTIFEGRGSAIVMGCADDIDRFRVEHQV